MGNILLITGDSGSGKTTLCGQAMSSLQRRGLDVAGILSLPIFEDGAKKQIDLLDVRTGQRQLLATRAGPGFGTAGLNWQFLPEALSSGSEILRSASPCDLLVVDELGPLELDCGEGWVCALEVLARGEYRTALVVVRRSLIPNLCARLGSPVAEIVVVNRGNQSAMLERIVALTDE